MPSKARKAKVPRRFNKVHREIEVRVLDAIEGYDAQDCAPVLCAVLGTLYHEELHLLGKDMFLSAIMRSLRVCCDALEVEPPRGPLN